MEVGYSRRATPKKPTWYLLWNKEESAAQMKNIEQLYETPIPIFLARTSDDLPPEWLESWCMRQTVEWKKTGRAPRGVLYRCVALDRLEDVLNDGIDVKGGPVYATEYLEKAWEYGDQERQSGGMQKLLLLLSQESLERSYRIFDKDTPKDEIEGHKKKYPTQLTLDDGSIWLSRLPPAKAGSDYEREYCWFPIDAPYGGLVALVIVLSPDTDPKSIEVSLATRFGRARPTA